MFKAASPEKRLEWEEKIQQQRKSGLSIERWCRENQTVVCQFHYWKARLFPKIDRSSFIELPDTKDVGISVEYDGVHIHLDKNFDASTLKRCLAVMKEVSSC